MQMEQAMHASVYAYLRNESRLCAAVRKSGWPPGLYVRYQGGDEPEGDGFGYDLIDRGIVLGDFFPESEEDVGWQPVKGLMSLVAAGRLPGDVLDSETAGEATIAFIEGEEAAPAPAGPIRARVPLVGPGLVYPAPSDLEDRARMEAA